MLTFIDPLCCDAFYVHQDVVAEQSGSDLPEGISAAVSSPGAERQIVIPDDLQRFGKIPLKVVFKNKSKFPMLWMVGSNQKN